MDDRAVGGPPDTPFSFVNASELLGRLRWFARDFVKAGVENDRLLITDLRMGQEPIYVFTHVVAERGNPHWKPMPTELISPTIDERVLLDAWKRMWTH